MTASCDDFRIVLTTVDSDELADRLARTLVERRLAACVNVLGPVRSVYRWKDEVTQDDERLLLIKTRQARLPALRTALRELHPYEVPEVLAIAINDGDRPYLEWLADCVSPDSKPPD